MFPGLTEQHAIETLVERFRFPAPDDETIRRFTEEDRVKILHGLLQLQGLDGNNAIPSHKQSAFYEAVHQFTSGGIDLEAYRVKINAILGTKIN